MTKEFAWMLGILLSDGCINKPSYRHKGDETHLEFICKYDDRKLMYKIKDILGASGNVCEYPDYKSPQAKLRVYNRKDIIEKYNDIKTKVPDDIKGYERHFIRGLIDGDGCLYYRKNRKSFCLSFVNEYESIVSWVAQTICNLLKFPEKNIRYISKDHIYEVRWEGNLARILAYWLYYGDISSCTLDRKQKYMYRYVLNDKDIDYDAAILYTANADIQDNEISFRTPYSKTLLWCHIVQNLLSFHTVPVFHNKGKKKYYRLYIPKNVNTQSVDINILAKA